MRAQRWFRDNFLAGLAIVLPVALSIFLFVWIIETITGRVSILITESWLQIETSKKTETPEPTETPEETQAREKNGLSRVDMFFLRVVILIAMVVVTITIGWLARTLIGRQLIKLSDMVLERIPLFNRIYVVLRQMSQSMLSEKSAMFSAVVLLQFPRPGIRSLAFITSRTKGEIQDKTQGEVFTLFVPTSPNPTSGFMIVATEDEFERLDMSVEQGMKMVISGGAVLPEGQDVLTRRRRAKTVAQQPPAAGTGQA